MAAFLAALATRFHAAAANLSGYNGTFKTRLLRALGAVPAAYRREVEPAASLMLGLIIAALQGPSPAEQELQQPAAVSSVLYTVVRLELELHEDARQLLRTLALRVVPEGDTRVLYWVVRAMTEGCIGVADEGAVEVVLERLSQNPPGNSKPVIRQLQLVTLDHTAWIQKYPAARLVWVRSSWPCCGKCCQCILGGIGGGSSPSRLSPSPFGSDRV